MSKFEVELEITGFKLKVKAEREEEVAQITNAVSNTVANMLSPVNNIVDGEVAEIEAVPHETRQLTESVTTSDRKKTKKKSSSRRKPSKNPEHALEWRHDTAKWGSPQRTWSTSKKAIWLMHVAKQETGNDEMTTSQIINTFNVQFSQAGEMRGNVNRDLGALMMKTNPVVSKNTTSKPLTWFLTKSGEQQGQNLVAEALGVATDSIASED